MNPEAEVSTNGSLIRVKWGVGNAAQSTTGSAGGSYSTAPYVGPNKLFATNSRGRQPFVETFGNLTECDGGILTVGENPRVRYRIRVQQQASRHERPAAPPPMKKVRPTLALGTTQIKPGTAVELPVQKLENLSPRKNETVCYYGREGAPELFSYLVDSKEESQKFKVTLLGHPGAGKGNLVWALAHHLVTETKDTVLWASRRLVSQKWVLRLFEWCTQAGEAKVYELENCPTKLADILKEPVLKDVSVLILDAPTYAKSTNPPSADGVAAFEWAGQQDRIQQRRVKHTTPLRAFSYDDRIPTNFKLENRTMRPWTRKDFVDALKDDGLKRQVCDTLGFDPTDKTAEEIVDANLYYSGINARWFFNFTIDEIKKDCRGILERMSPDSTTVGIAHDRAVNSPYVNTWDDDDDQEVKLFTSRYLAGLSSKNSNLAKKFFELYPMMKGRLGNGAPGEILEADFLLNLEQCHSNLEQYHSIAVAQRHFMGDKAQEVGVVIGKDSSTGESVQWPKLSSLPKNNTAQGAQPMPFRHSQVKRVPQWLVPDDTNQPFLDFLVLVPVSNSTEWEARTIQNTVSHSHSTDLKQLQRVLIGMERAGFVLASSVKMFFVIEVDSQANLGSSINGATVKIPKPRQANAASTRSKGTPTKDFTVVFSHVMFQRTASAITVALPVEKADLDR